MMSKREGHSVARCKSTEDEQPEGDSVARCKSTDDEEQREGESVN